MKHGYQSVDKLLENTKKSLGITTLEAPKKKAVSKIERAGEIVMKHIIELFYKSDLSYRAISVKINETYDLDLNEQNIYQFFKSNMDAIELVSNEKREIARMRARMILEYNEVLTKDLKLLDTQIDNVTASGSIQPFYKAKAIADLVDKKGRLLLRYEKMCGNIHDIKGDLVKNKTEIHQTNVYNQVSDEKSELISRLKKADFDHEPNPNPKIVDV